MTCTLDDFKPFISPEVPGVDVITLENQIRLTIGEFCEETWLLKRGFSHDFDTDDIDTEFNDSITINLSGYANTLRPIWIDGLIVDGNVWNTQYLDLVNHTEDIDLLKDSDCKVFSFPTTTSIILAPFETAGSLFMSIVFKPLPDAATFDERLLYDYVRGISAGVKAELMAQPGLPWSNEQRAAYFSIMYRKEMNNAKLKLSKDYSRKSKSVYPREFGF